MKTSFTLQFQGTADEFTKWVKSAPVRAAVKDAGQLSISITGEGGQTLKDPAIQKLHDLHRVVVTNERRFADVVAAVKKGLKIEAIKILREISGLGLKESKDFIEAHIWTRFH